MKNFVNSLNEEYHIFQKKYKNKRNINAPTISGKKVFGLSGLYLSLHTFNNDYQNEYYDLETIKTNNIEYKNIELKSLKIIDYKVNNEVLCFKKDISDLISDFDFNYPDKEALIRLKKALLNKDISGFSKDSNIVKSFGDIITLPIKNFSFSQTEVINQYFLNIKKHIQRKDQESIEKERFENLFNKNNAYENDLFLKELTYFDLNNKLDNYIDLSGFSKVDISNQIVSDYEKCEEITEDIIKTISHKNNIRM